MLDTLLTFLTSAQYTLENSLCRSFILFPSFPTNSRNILHPVTIHGSCTTLFRQFALLSQLTPHSHSVHGRPTSANLDFNLCNLILLPCTSRHMCFIVINLCVLHDHSKTFGTIIRPCMMPRHSSQVSSLSCISPLFTASSITLILLSDNVQFPDHNAYVYSYYLYRAIVQGEGRSRRRPAFSYATPFPLSMQQDLCHPYPHHGPSLVGL